MDVETSIKFLQECARGFARRAAGETEDMAFWADVSNAENCRKIAEELRTIARELDEACRELEHFRTSGIIEVAVRNPSVSEYMDHWEGRAEEAEADRDRLRDALTPSPETKAAYVGEFSVPLPEVDEDGNEYICRINVPWTTIKAIMAAIRFRAARDFLATKEKTDG